MLNLAQVKGSTGRAVALTAGGIILLDTFTGADTTALNGRAADTGQTWTAPVGWTLSGNKLVASALIDACHVDVGVSDYTASLDLTHASNQQYLVVAYQDVNNHVIAGFQAGETTLRAWERKAGNYTEYAGSTDVGSHTGTVSIRKVGTSYTVFWNGASTITFTEADFSTETEVGVWGNAASVDNLTVEA